MKLSEYRGEEALEVVADLIDPISSICEDEELVKKLRDKESVMTIVKPILKTHKKEVIQILAILDRKTESEYVKEINLFTLPAKLIELLNDPELKNLFTLQDLKTEETSLNPASTKHA